MYHKQCDKDNHT